MSRRAGLDRTIVACAAAELIDHDTLNMDGLSLSRVAERLGVRTPSLYKHVDGLPALRRELALLALEQMREVLADAAVGRSGDAALRAVAAAYRSFAREHPGLYGAAQRTSQPGDAAHEEAGRRVVDIILRILEPYGLSGDDALHAVRGLRSVLHGFVSLEAAGGFGLPLDLDESYRRLVEGFLLALRSGT